MAATQQSPNPSPVYEARQMIQAGERRDENFSGMRPYFCRNCGREEHSNCIPRGWYLLARAKGNFERHQRLGLFCSAACIEGQTTRLTGIEKNLGDRWDQVPSPYQE
jgi:hypothetical protein